MLDREEGKKEILRKAVIGGNLSIWNRLMGGKPIRIQLKETSWENLAGQGGGKKGSDWRKFSIWNRLIGRQTIRIQLKKTLQENLAGQGGEEKGNLRKAVIGGNLAFGIG